MVETEARERWRPTRTTLVAGGLALAGLMLTELNWWFLLLAALGALGPGVLRELGLLHDKDEFQCRADHRAGYHAFLAVGLVAFVFVAFFRSGERVIEHTDRMATLFLSLLWFTWLLSSLLAYWGPQRASTWILRIFGSVVLVFAIISNLGSEWTGWAAVLLTPLLAAPFFGLAWLAGHRPRMSGVLLLAVFGLFLVLFGAPRAARTLEMTDGVVEIFVLGPLLASGIALLRVRNEDDEMDEAAEIPIPAR